MNYHNSITFFNYLCHLIKKEYPDEMTVSEFVSVMTEVLHEGGIDHVEYGVGSLTFSHIVPFRPFV